VLNVGNVTIPYLPGINNTVHTEVWLLKAKASAARIAASKLAALVALSASKSPVFTVWHTT
jgi:hypothetical protein